ncbi:MAG: c-type cytochrome, partial [Planctomycetota bacterium]
MPTKKEEHKSYLIHFVVFSFILAAVTLWAVVNETVDRRPWKKYQKQFHRMEYEKIKQDDEKERAVFESPEVQGRYGETKKKLDRAREDFQKPAVQDEYNKLVNELKTLNKDAESLRFTTVVTRNESMAKEYLFGKTQDEHIKDEILLLDEMGKSVATKLKVAEDRVASAKTRIIEVTRDITAYSEELESYSTGLKRHEAQLRGLKKAWPTLQVYQTYLEDLNVTDRCMSCHVGIDKAEGVSQEQPYTPHPNRELYLGNHPPERFGCVLCHEGQASATSGVKEAHGEVEYWLSPINRGAMAQASCIRCHSEGKEVRGGERLWQGRRLFEELGCYGCHETAGFGTDKQRMIGPGLKNIKDKVKAGWLAAWIKDPKVFRPTTRMPDFRLTEEESQAIAAYLWQHVEGKGIANEIPSFDEEQLSQGNFAFEQAGCMACHTSDEKETTKGFGPHLSRISEKLNYGYLVEWIMNPKGKEPLTRMPGFRLNQDKARLIAGYLIHKTGSNGAQKAPPVTAWLEDKEYARVGEGLIKAYGCFGCHEIKGMEGLGKIGVELSAIGSKHVPLFDFGLLEKKILGEAGIGHPSENVGKARQAWLRAKLQNPRQFDEGRYKKPEDRLKMPDFGLTEEESASLVVLLTGLREEKLPEKYVKGLTERERAITEGKRLIGKYNCIGCHQLDLDRLRLIGNIEAAGMVKLEEEGGLYFQLWEDNKGLGRKAGETVFIENERIIEKEKASVGNVSPKIIEYHVDSEGLMPEEALVFAPPLLYGEGKKVQPEWLFEFLKEPFDLRPWLDVKMPTFGLPDSEATSLARFFAEISHEAYPFDYIAETKKEYLAAKESRSPGYLLSAKRLFESKDINCILCHVKGEKMPE